jgi:superfamily I DNA/RNA helicase
VSNILEFEAHFPDPVVVKLEQNYRSTNSILNTANFLIKNNPRRRPKQLWSSAGDGDKVRIVGMSDDRQEAEFIANEIAQRSVTESAPHEEFAILFRMNAQSRLLETNLRQLNIPYRVIGGKSFFDRREVKDLLAYANCLVNTDDDVSLLRIINTPARGISSNTVEKATDFSAKQKCSVFEVLTNEAFRGTLTKRTVESLDRFVELLDRFETKLNTPLSDHAAVLREMMKETGYLDELKRTCKTPQEALSRETNLMDLLKSFEDYQGRSSEGLRGFLDEMSLRQEREEDDDDARGTGVTLITLHAAKGLEYPHVYLIGLEEGLLPHDRSKLEGTVDEERRLLYVGITRARRTLALSWCRHRIKYGSPMPCTPSSFIKELPPEWIIHRDATQILQAPVSEAAAKSKFGALRAAVERATG